ncbi:ParA family protein [Zoogloea sp.]|uniref:ParA family protein n=1 Tax=Zoogloea sp. TaxID=49181 RepID=UPI0026339F28|nr:ParA family protein [Zoogloea sp.]MDD3353264.1 ParA family protein [Zoogloea sp.]
MHTILLANPKGGCGKSTLATHLASWFAQQDDMVCLGDLDRQQSSALWLARRPASLPKIHSWSSEDGVPGPTPKTCNIGILDTPAGLHGRPLRQLLKEVDRVVVPVAPSRFDLMASRDFFEELAEIKSVRKDRVRIALVGMRVDPRTSATQQMIEFLEQFDLPLVTCIRSAQRYVQAIENGETLFDRRSGASQADQRQWQPLLEWLVTRR